MSTANPGESLPDDDILEFDEAEFTADEPAVQLPTCANCLEPIPDVYFVVGGKVFCDECLERIEEARRSGSGMVRFVKASVFGLGAAIVGALIYYITVRTTNLNIGLIAILVGYLVGKAVRSGSGDRGGLAYQFLALFLTYSAIVGMFVPLIIEEIVKGDPQNQAALDPAAPANGAGNAAPAPADPAPAAPAGPLAIVTYFGLMIALFYSIPVQEAMSAPISGVIYAFGLWQAWRLTMPTPLVINGPYQVERGSALGPEGGHAG